MNPFDKSYNSDSHSFIKSNPENLQSLFGFSNLIPLWLADMDFKIAEEITEELQHVINRGIYAYESHTEEIFKAICEWNLKRNKLKLDSNHFIQITGVLTGIALLIRKLSKEGDEILVQTPVYHHFYKIIKSSKRKIVSSSLINTNGYYQMDFIDLEQKLQKGSIKIILLCNPHNPVGRVWQREELEKLIHLANTYKATIISDEIHSDIIYKNSVFNSIASFNQEQHIVLLGSPAKTFGMQSISNGYIYIPKYIVHKQIKHAVASLYLDHGNAFTTSATIAAYTKGAKWVDALIEYLQKTVFWIEKFIENEMPKITLTKPEGTYQIWLDFRGLQLSDSELKNLIFNKAKIALTPGSWFDKNQPQFMRMNIASPLKQIQQAFLQLKKAMYE